MGSNYIPFSSLSSSLVLLIEDDADVRECIRELLEARGYAVSCASNGLDALRRLPQIPRPAVILLDLDMPLMDGWEFLKHLREDEPWREWAGLPVVVLAGIVRRALPEGTASLQKPFHLERLFDVVRTACSGAGG